MISFFEELLYNLPDWGPEFLAAAGQTLKLATGALLFAVPFGILLALLRLSTIRPVKWLAVTVIEIGRGTPPLVILFLIYFGLPDVVPALRLTSFWAAVIGLGLQGGAILAEVFRSGIEAIDRGQREASLSLGMTPVRSMLDVVAPQAFHVALPPFGNYVVGLIKDTSIASIISAPEIILRAKDLASTTFMPMHLYVLAAIVYFILSYPLSVFVRSLETNGASAAKS